MLFDICQMLNEINRGYLPQKGGKGAGGMSNVELINVEFRRGDFGVLGNYCGFLFALGGRRCIMIVDMAMRLAVG